MKRWVVTGFKGINNYNTPDRLDQPIGTKEGNIGNCELAECINFDIDDNGSLIKRENDQAIFSQPYDAKLTQSMAGITYTATGRLLRYTKPFSLEYNPQRSTIEYASPIILIQEVETGMWVSTTEKIYFHSGRNPAAPDGFRLSAEYDYPAVMGTGEKIYARDLGIDMDGFVAMFLTTRGICYGTQTGNLHNVSSGTYTVPVASRGISLVDKSNGIKQYKVKIINGTDDDLNMYTPRVEVEVDSK